MSGEFLKNKEKKNFCSLSVNETSTHLRLKFDGERLFNRKVNVDVKSKVSSFDINYNYGQSREM